MVQKQDGHQTISPDCFIQKNFFSLNIKWSRLIDHSKTGLKCPVFEWFESFETDLQNVRISNESGFRMVGFRIPTVLHYACIFYDGVDSIILYTFQCFSMHLVFRSPLFCIQERKAGVSSSVEPGLY